MTDLILRSTKFDGSLHYRYAVRQVDASEDRLAVYTGPGTPVESYRGCWIRKKHVLSIYLRDRPHVVHASWAADWTPETLYIDIATGTAWGDGKLTYVDLDLDVTLRAGETDPRVEDEDEFEVHRLKWNYPPELVARCRQAVTAACRMLKASESPFTPALFAWRLGAALPI